MSFYQKLQLGVGDLKTLIRAAESPSEKRTHAAALWVKNILCILFALTLIGGISALFGNENSSAGVVIFCILLTVRFIDFGYDVASSLWALALSFAIMTFGPVIAAAGNPLWAFSVNGFCILTLLLLTSMNPRYGNQGLYVFGYLLLQGFPVTGHMLFLRILCMGGGALLCGIVFYRAHHCKQYALTGAESLRQFSLSSPVSRWQVKMALGISLVLLLGQIFRLPKTMWLSISCMSVLQMDANVVKDRFCGRVPFVLLGSLVFGLLLPFCPENLFSLFGIIGGLGVGFSASYRWKSFFNCFGALAPASLLFGGGNAVLLRIALNFFGAAFAFLFYHFFDKAVQVASSVRKFSPDFEA